MANTNAPRGFWPRKDGIGSAWAATLNSYPIASGYATNIFQNDVVKLLTTGFIAKAAAGDQMRGVAIGFKWTDLTGKLVASPYWPAGTVTKGALDAQVLMIDDPNTVFEAQFTNSASVPANADQGANFNLFDAGGGTAAGLSGEGIDYSTLTTAAAQFRFLGFSTRPDSDKTSAYSYGMFVPSLHDFRVNTAI